MNKVIPHPLILLPLLSFYPFCLRLHHVSKWLLLAWAKKSRSHNTFSKLYPPHLFFTNKTFLFYLQSIFDLNLLFTHATVYHTSNHYQLLLNYHNTFAIYFHPSILDSWLCTLITVIMIFKRNPTLLPLSHFPGPLHCSQNKPLIYPFAYSRHFLFHRP